MARILITGSNGGIAYRVSKAAVNKAMQGRATALAPEGIPAVLIDPDWLRADNSRAGANEDPAGVLCIAKSLTPKDTGKFFRFTGEEREF